jgi:outer membrane immunogenic protein
MAFVIGPMNRTLAFAVATICLVCGATGAQATDMPVKGKPVPFVDVPFGWTGFYVGANGGYGWGRSSWSDPTVGADSGRFNTRGALLGGQLGYNWQFGSVVFGVETDADWTNLTGNSTGSVCLADGGGSCQTKQDWFGTTRGRIGYAFGRWLPYVTGGAAYGDIKALQSNGTSTTVKFGWTAGGGLEYSIDRNWSAKVEYLHLDLGTADFFSAANGATTLSVPAKDDLVRAGVNYHW